jgi:hypothetical protein
MKADDDTYVHTRNLRRFLSAYNSSEYHYFGSLVESRMHTHCKGRQMSPWTPTATNLFMEEVAMS